LSEAPEIIKKLVNKFDHNLAAYKSSDYKEEQLKQEFINPFFKALGWDVDNESDAAPQYRDVIFEDSIKVGGGTKAPDYCFTLAGRRMFFVEAKKPSVNINEGIEPSYQLRRYAWSAKLHLSILTDFEELAIYESRTKPKKNDRASTGRITYLTYKDYVEKWDEIYNIFSKEAVLKGSFDLYAESTKKKKGTTEVDDAFLSEIENWRELFARNIALRNPEISIAELNYSVQQIIDRLVFLRMCEDRGAERYEQLRDLLDHNSIYDQFCELCKKADEKYNSGLFHFKEEKGRDTPPDTLTLDLKIDDGIFQTIIKNLYYPNSPYEFSVLSPEILGNVYEQFLGKVIRLTKKHQAKVEEKPEVKKAGGVYYTPQFVVEYIVENTVGKLINGKTPNQVSEIKLLDPACGSGSFLLGAYSYILNWHRDYYSTQKNKNRLKDKIYKGKGDEWFLTIKEKKRILLNNIYGVDIDNQAVEVTKLSLLLKVLEGENKDALEAQQKLFRERALPDLENNIKCGNSLIGPNIYNDPELKLTAEDITRINTFEWEDEFKDIIDNGGFDAVIGNPPYLRIQGLQEYYGNQISYFVNTYQSAVKRFDLYLLFLEKGFNLLKEEGHLGYICPHKFLISDFGSGIRQFFIDNKALSSIISFGENLVFKHATTYTGIFLLSKNSNNLFCYHEFSKVSNNKLASTLFKLNPNNFADYDLDNFTKKPWILTNKEIQDIIKKLYNQPLTLGDISKNLLVGIQSGVDEIDIMEYRKDISDEILSLFSEKENKEINIEKGLVKPILRGEDIHQYKKPEPMSYCIYPYKLVNDKTRILEEKELKQLYPLGYDYLKEHKKELKEIRVKQKTNKEYWYSCHRSREINLFEINRIITPYASLGCNMTLVEPGIYQNTKVYSIIIKERQKEDIKYWLGILNSKIMWFFMSKTGYVLRGGYYAFTKDYMSPFPIKQVNFEDNEEKNKHDMMVLLVTHILELKKDIDISRTPQDKKLIQRQIDARIKHIDQMVYDLYGLTPEDIKIIEDNI